MQYLAFIHEEDGTVGVSFPDLPGCVSAGDTIDDALHQAQEALALHVAGMKADGEALPHPRSISDLMRDESLDDWREGAIIASVPVVIDRGSPKRVNISLDPGLLEAIDEEATARGMTRSALLASAARKEIQGNWALKGGRTKPVK